MTCERHTKGPQIHAQGTNPGRRGTKRGAPFAIVAPRSRERGNLLPSRRPKRKKEKKTGEQTTARTKQTTARDSQSKMRGVPPLPRRRACPEEQTARRNDSAAQTLALHFIALRFFIVLLFVSDLSFYSLTTNPLPVWVAYTYFCFV